MDGRYCNCWNCGHHRLGDALAALTNRPLGTVLGWLANMGEKGPSSASNKRSAGGRVVAPPGLSGLSRAHRAYLERRGFCPDQVAKLWGVQGFTIHPQYSWRIWIPIHQHGKLVSWTTRSTGDGGAKYLSAKPEQEAVPHKHLLYGACYARHAVVVCEGPLDVWAVGPGAVATFGLSVSAEQIQAIGRFPRRVFLFDGEPDAQRTARQLAGRLSLLPGETYVVELETGPDPAEADPEELWEVREKFLDGSKVTP